MESRPKNSCWKSLTTKTLVECHVKLDRADNKGNANNARLSITFTCDNDECQTLEELEAQKNSHLVEFGTEEANSCLLARGNLNARTTSWTTSSGATRPALSASSTE